jgi:hypothetical protein
MTRFLDLEPVAVLILTAIREQDAAGWEDLEILAHLRTILQLVLDLKEDTHASTL